MAQLALDPRKRFIVVEQCYFQRWFHDTSPENRLIFRHLLSNGQIEFVMGGWAMSDEASTLFESTVNQLALGRRWLAQEFQVSV